MAIGGFALFDTPVGACGIAWTSHGLCGLQLPEPDRETTLARLARRFPTLGPAATDEVAAVIAQVNAHLGGEAVDYAGVKLDFDGIQAFEQAVYTAARAIPFGETRTYGALATQLGEPQAAQAVGQALGRNPWPILVPCHRITAADGKTGGFSAAGGVSTKLKLLEIEGALAVERLPLFATPDS